MPYSFRRYGKFRCCDGGIERSVLLPSELSKVKDSLGVNGGIYELVSLLITLREV